MKKISFNKLCKLVSEVDYINPKSYPIQFEVNDVEYCVGIGSFDVYGAKEKGYDVENFFGCLEDELQYLLKTTIVDDDILCTFVDVQDPDAMSYEGIVAMLKKQCNITKDSVIYLYDEDSFNGVEDCIDYESLSEEVLYKEQNHPCRLCKEVSSCYSNCEKVKDFYKKVVEKFGN